jgi:hypothetical protein
MKCHSVLNKSTQVTTMKSKIPKALREQVWIVHVGKKYEVKCLTSWCSNKMTVFDFQCGHDVPESKGGGTDITNLVPICSRCNLSMSNDFTFREWCYQSKPPSKWKLFWKKWNILKWTLSGTKVSGTQSNQNNMNQKNKPSK